jgi:hypothetical protein
MSGEGLDYERLADIWYGIMNTEPPAQFGEWLRSDVGSESMPQPGFVGSRYRAGGMLLLSMNPVRITKNQETDSERRFYAALKNMKQGIPDRVSAFQDLNRVTEEVAPNWRFYELWVAPVLYRLTWPEVAYLNLLKWHSGRKPKIRDLYRWSWENHTGVQINALSPGLVAFVGVGRGSLSGAVLNRLDPRGMFLKAVNLPGEG